MDSLKTQHRVLVLGAGTIGLSSAVRIQRSCDNVHVTLMADKFSPDTTSDGSAGFLFPYGYGRDDDVTMLDQLARETFEYLNNIAFSDLCEVTGVNQLSGYVLAEERLQEKHSGIVFGERNLNSLEIANFPGAKDGVFKTTVQVDVTKYMAWLIKSFKTHGGAVVSRKVESLSELAGHWDVVVICCGIGAKALLGDDQMQPARGQVLRMRAPWIKHSYIYQKADGNWVYILPGANEVVVGGTYQKGDWNTSASDDDSRAIWRSACQTFPFIKGAKLLRQWAGLRPCRSKLRLERETIQCDGFGTQLVHNYGHGGSGIAFHWACARVTAELVQKALGVKRDKTECVKSRL